MPEKSSAARKPTRAKKAAGKPGRLYFIDHLRAALIILVVLHHVALVYGAIELSFYYLEPPTNDPLAFTALLAFALGNQGWFMGAFFLLAGYFTPGSYARRGAGGFLKERLLRLGLPILLFIFVLNPVSAIGYFLMPASLTGITTPLSWAVYPYMLGLGPLWFVAMLLIFCFGYVGWRWLTRNRKASATEKASTPSWLGIVVFILALAVVSTLFRVLVPLGKPVSLLVDFLSFPTIAYLPQYLSFFILGAVASHRDWFRTIMGSMGAVGAVLAVLASVLLFPLAISGQWFSLQITEALGKAFGYGTWQSAVYALWDSILAVGLCLALIPFFRRVFNGEGKMGTFLAQQSYGVYIFHIPIVVFLAYGLRGVALAALLKFGLVSLIAVPVCFVVVWAIRKIPGVARVI